MKTIKNMPRYSVYKDSGVEWLGETPVNWKIMRLAHYFIERNTKVSDKDYMPLSVTKQGVLPQLEHAAKTNDGDNRKLVQKNDFVINSRSDRKGSSGISKFTGSVSLINIILKPIDIHPDFCDFLLKSTSFIEEFYRIGHGIVADLWTTRYQNMKNIILAMPPYDEQVIISHFLVKKISQIDQAIAIKEKQIALLKERQQIIIQRAVTQGLDPNVPMKDSGIEWIGMIPEHWKIIKLKYSTYINQNSLTESTSPNLEFEYVDIGNVTFDSGIIGKEKYTFRTSPSRARRIAKVGDTIVSTVRTYLKAISEIDEQYQYCIYSTGFAVLSPQKELNNKYLTFFIKSDSFTNQVSSVAKGMSYPAINSSELSNLYICIPPYVEQKTIEKHIQKLTLKIEKLLSLYLEQIEKLKEYKATLIDSAVTGKIKITTEE